MPSLDDSDLLGEDLLYGDAQNNESMETKSRPLVSPKKQFLGYSDEGTAPSVPPRPTRRSTPKSSNRHSLPEVQAGAVLSSEVDDSDLLGESLLQDSRRNDETPILNRSHPLGPLDKRLKQARIASSKESGTSRLVIGIDYGTTYTGVSFAYTDLDSNESIQIDLDSIEVVQNWTTRMNNQDKVRSLMSYTQTANGEAQWGTDISNNAVTMVNTKLELEIQDSLFDELDLTLNVLRGTGNLEFEHLKQTGPSPDYSSKSPMEIVTDYLTKVYECACNEIDRELLEQTNTAVDIVVTVPVNWSYDANDATFKAIRGAGFNKTNFPTLKDTILVSEPEAASHFTARDYQKKGTEFLRVNDCFILCDAGGGTVDVVSFQVKRTEPYFELEKATEPKSAKCGSVYIDTAFKTWLRDVIGVDKYQRLDPANARHRLSAHTVESGPMRKLVEDFEAKKKTFSESSEDVKLNLPPPLDKLTIRDRVNEGELTVYRDEMKRLIDGCASDVTELIIDQINKIKHDKNRRTKNVFLVGGFGASPYLREKIQEGLEMRKMVLRRPDGVKPWTAIVQGAVIYGIEKTKHPDASYMAAMTRSYGILVNGEFKWLVRKGDLVLSNEKRTINGEYFKVPRNEMSKFELPLYVYNDLDEDDDVPDFYEDGQHVVDRVGIVKCDFSKYQDVNLRAGRMYGTSAAASRRGSRSVPLRCQIQLSTTTLEAAVLLDKERVGRCEIQIKVDPAQTDSSDFA